MQNFLHEDGFKPMPMLEGSKWQAAASTGKKLEPVAWNIQSSGICCIVCLDYIYSILDQLWGMRLWFKKYYFLKWLCFLDAESLEEGDNKAVA